MGHSVKGSLGLLPIIPLGHRSVYACKCYVRTFIAMGFTLIRRLVSTGMMTQFQNVNAMGVDEFCRIDRKTIEARVPRGKKSHLARLSPAAVDLLLSAESTSPRTPEAVNEILRSTAIVDDNVPPVGRIVPLVPM